MVLEEEEMRRILAIVLVSTLFSGCCLTDGAFCKGSFHSAACGGEVEGYTWTAVAYGDSKMLVVPLSKIRNDTEWRFILKPVRLPTDPPLANYENATVTITGKTAADTWINTAGPGNSLITGDFATNDTLTACVKGLPDITVDTDYSYIVDVATVGRLDPRGRVEK